jgi:hypothetical protein
LVALERFLLSFDFFFFLDSDAEELPEEEGMELSELELEELLLEPDEDREDEPE